MLLVFVARLVLFPWLMFKFRKLRQAADSKAATNGGENIDEEELLLRV